MTSSLHARARSALPRCALLLSVLACACTAPKPDPLPPEPTALPSSSASATPIASASSAPPARPYGELDIDPVTFEFAKNPELTQRIAETPHAYFRFVGSASRRAICEAFAADIAKMPRVRLHGDAHIEQYAVTDLGRWLMDYDDAAIGPPVIDLAHMGVSLILGERQLGGAEADVEQALSEMLRGYADGLAGKVPPKDTPGFAKELVAKMSKDRRAFLENSEKAMALPLDAESDARARAELSGYAAAVAKAGPKHPKWFFDVKRVGAQKLGIGSAKVRRYLFRLEGPTTAPDDDLMVEVKEVSDLSGATCVTGVPDGVVAERAAAQKRAGMDKKLLPPILLPGGRFWASEWLPNYFEVKLKKLGKSDLPTLAYETGMMLALEHMKPLPETGKAVDPKSLAITPATADAIGTVAKRLADESEAGWKRFKVEVAEPRSTP